MEFLIADTFTDALARLPAQEQKAAKTSAFDLQLDPSSPGLQFHRIEKSKDPNFWSMRVNRDLRIVVHKTAASVLLAWVGHHDAAYAWAERRRIEAHPRTGAVQIVEVRERVEAALVPRPVDVVAAAGATTEVPAEAERLFARLAADDLFSVGVPEDWVAPVLAATEDAFFALADHLPAESAEALLQYAATGILSRPVPAAAVADPFAHPDARRRFRVIENQVELEAALDAPWERWSIFLHPSQRDVVERAYAGPARVAGSAGTGKTVVALHRAVRLARDGPSARVLLTTFSRPLADALRLKLAVLVAAEPGVAGRITVTPWTGLADELHQLAFGRRPRVATETQVRAALTQATSSTGVTGFSDRFLASEFAQVIDAWQVGDADAYAQTPRPGRRSRLGARQRERLWPVFADARRRLRDQGLTTWPAVFGALTAHYAGAPDRPFSNVVVDEAQDLGVPELRLLAAVVSTAPDALFFAGDLGQRIFQPPVSWKMLGVDVRGRSTILGVNYRTSRQIRQAADRLLPDAMRDVDGLEEVRRGTVSVFEGVQPEVRVHTSVEDELDHAARFIQAAIADGISGREIGVFVRSRAELDRARRAVRSAGLNVAAGAEASSERSVLVTTMHLAKGLEFKVVVVMACDAAVLPSAARLAEISDELELDEVYETERQLLYVACTRARDRLLVSGVRPASEYLDDLLTA